MSSEPDKTPNSSTGRPPLIAIVVSIASLALAIAHVVMPDVRVDGVVVALVAAAAVPWLGPLFRSIELPGGWKLEFREFQQTVTTQLRDTGERIAQIGDQVEEIKLLAFDADVAPDVREKIEAPVAAFHAHLIALGLEDLGDIPRVSILNDPGLVDVAYYDPGGRVIAVGRNCMDDTVHVLGIYALYVLGREVEKTAWSEARAALESGLARYLARSFKDAPSTGSTRYRWSDVPRTGDAQEYVLLGEVWSGAFWDLRDQAGSDTVDRALVHVWQRLDPTPEIGLAEWFVSALATQLASHDIREIFQNREITSPPKPTRRGG
jgi:hypothetical protein